MSTVSILLLVLAGVIGVAIIGFILFAVLFAKSFKINL